jgi:hypothetical protein
MRRTVVCFAALILATASPAFAQQDTTPPVLLDFTISPTVFDTGPSEVVLTLCVTARDDLSGLSFANTSRFASVNELGPGIHTSGASFSGELEATVCWDATVPRYKIYDIYALAVTVRDMAGNSAIWGHPHYNLNAPDLCALGPCEVENRPGGGLPDFDGDTIPDDADNCPDDPNLDQADADLDLIGDECDPFPTEPDHDKAQCFVDLDQVIEELAICLVEPLESRDPRVRKGRRR